MSVVEHGIDPNNGSAFVINESGLPDEDIFEALKTQAPEIAALTRWSTSNQSRGRMKPGGGRYQTIFDRDRFVSPDNIFDKFRVATDAAENDDVVAGVTETTEQLAFKRVTLETEDEDQQDIWCQMADELDLAQRMREIWREIFIVSQCYIAVIYGRKSFKVSEKGRKKTFNKILAPTGISLLDPLKVIPVGNFLFNKEKLVYLAEPSEAADFDRTLAGENSSDLIVNQLLQGRYEASESERRLIQDITGTHQMQDMFLLNPRNVFRITATRPQYKRFASVRLESVFELLDLKHQLRQMDRSSLIGSTNAIILVKKGNEKHIPKPEEMQRLATQVGGTSQRPILVGDYTLNVEIITPKTDKTLAAERYNALDSRISARLWQAIMSGNYAMGTATDNTQGLMRMVAASMEARRDNIRDALMNNIFDYVWRTNDSLSDRPKMAFHPGRIALDFDPTIAEYLQTLRDRGDLSRETILAELDIIQSDEAKKRKREEKKFDDVFTPPNNVPFDSPNHGGPNGTPPEGEKKPMTKSEQKAAGRTGGGNNNGGGRNPKSSQPTNTKK